MPRINKWITVRYIQGKFAGSVGWEDCAGYLPGEKLLPDLKQYRESGQGVYRVIRRQEINPEWEAVHGQLR